MKKLFAVPIMGAGTVNVECLPSYLLRLSDAHGLSTGQLFSHLNQWARVHQADIGSKIGIDKRLPLVSTSRPNKASADLLQVLTHATGNAFLRTTTFYALSTPYWRMYGYAGLGFRWCPACMAEWQKRDEEAYFMLAWVLNEVTYCHIHNVLLRLECQHCEKEQRQGKMGSPLHLCIHCGKSLGGVIRKSDIVSARDRTAGDLFHLIEQIALNPDLEFPDYGVHRVMTTLDREADRSEDAHKVFNALFPIYWNQVDPKGKRLTFPQCRAFAALAGMTLYDVLIGNCIGQTRTIDYAWGAGVERSCKTEVRQRRDFEKFKEAVDQALLDTKGEFPSLELFAKLIGVSPGYMRYKFPIVAHAITTEYQEHKLEERRQKISAVRHAILEILTDPEFPDHGKSKKSLLRYLRLNTDYAKHFIREQINEVIETLALTYVASG